MKITSFRAVATVLGALALGGCGAETPSVKSTPPTPSASPSVTTSSSPTVSPSATEAAPKPGQELTRAMITLSTCATPEDHAAGNYWADEFDNPEHRIDKIGVLVGIR